MDGTLAVLTAANVGQFYTMMHGEKKRFLVNMILAADESEFSIKKQAILQSLLIAVTGELKSIQSQEDNQNRRIIIKHLEAERLAITNWIRLENRMSSERDKESVALRKAAERAGNKAHHLCAQYSKAVDHGWKTEKILKKMKTLGDICRKGGVSDVSDDADEGQEQEAE